MEVFQLHEAQVRAPVLTTCCCTILQEKIGTDPEEVELPPEERPMSVPELALDLLCRIECTNDLVDFMAITAGLLSRCAEMAPVGVLTPNHPME